MNTVNTNDLNFQMSLYSTSYITTPLATQVLTQMRATPTTIAYAAYTNCNLFNCNWFEFYYPPFAINCSDALTKCNAIGSQWNCANVTTLNCTDKTTTEITYVPATTITTTMYELKPTYIPINEHSQLKTNLYLASIALLILCYGIN